MLKYKGTTIFPESIISVLEGESLFHSGYVEVKKNTDGTDRVILSASFNDNSGLNPENKINWIKEKLRAKIRVAPEVIIVSRNDADKKIYQLDKKRKRQTFFDLR
jgi:phenylacetate-CoA ligase